MRTLYVPALVRVALVALIALAPQMAFAERGGEGHGNGGVGGGMGGGHGGGGGAGGSGSPGGAFGGFGGVGAGSLMGGGGSVNRTRYGSHLGSLRDSSPSNRPVPNSRSAFGTPRAASRPMVATRTRVSRPTTFTRLHSMHTALRTSTRLHHRKLASGSGMPAGFSHGNASWKKSGGTPPGWSQGNKTGWGCTPGSSGCMPPGLGKKTGASGIQTASQRAHPRIASGHRVPQLTAGARTPMLTSGDRTPLLTTRAPTLHSRTPTTSTPRLSTTSISERKQRPSVTPRPMPHGGE